MKFLGYIQNGTLTFPAVQYQLRQQFVATIKTGDHVEETLVRKGDPKTKEQLGYAFAVVVAMVKIYFDENGIDLFGCAPTARFTKEILYNACAEDDDNGRRLTLSGMDKKQAAAFIDRCTHWAATQLGLYIPPADSNWRNKNVQ